MDIAVQRGIAYVDESLIGGYVVKVGYKEYDHSYEGRLRQLQRKLTGR